jgi:hypothetical protein
LAIGLSDENVHPPWAAAGAVTGNGLVLLEWYPRLLSSLQQHEPDRMARSSGWRLHDGTSVSDMDAPPLLVHRAVAPPAQGDQVLELGWTPVRPVDDVVPVNLTGPRLVVHRL